MSLDLLKKRFNSSTSTNKKEVDKEKLNEVFNSNNTHGLLNINEQHKKELEEKDRVIENLKQELNSQWLTNQTAFNTKKMYEDKIKKMDIVDSTNLIPTLMEVSKQKQGNVKLDWMSWLEIPESNYLFQINESLAKKVFQENNLLIDRLKYKKGRGGDAPYVDINYFLSFTGDSNSETARADLVRTDFTPNDPTGVGFSSSDRKPLCDSGFTISYWYRNDEVVSGPTKTDLFAMGWKHNTNGNARFEFGLKNSARPWFGIGNNAFNSTSWHTLLTNSGFSDNYNIDDFLDGDANLKTGKWNHIVVSFVGEDGPNGEQYRRIYFNGYQIRGYNSEAIGTAYNDYFNVNNTGHINWDKSTDAQMTRGFSFGMRALKATGTMPDGTHKSKYNNGHACALDDVAIYNEVKDNDWVRSVYNGGTGYNHLNSGGDGLVAYWKFNEGSGTTVKDLGPYGWHGTLTNAGVGEGDDIVVQTATTPLSIRDISSGVPTWNEIVGGY